VGEFEDITCLTTFSVLLTLRLQPPEARNARTGRDAHPDGAPPVGCKPMLDCLSSLPQPTWPPADHAAVSTSRAGVPVSTAV